MKIALLIPLVFLMINGYSQKGPYNDIVAEHKRADSLELLLQNGCDCKVINDTLPLGVLDGYDESKLWRHMRVVRYYFNNANKDLKKIDYRDGQRGDYSFYFEGNSFRKVRAIKNGLSVNIQYYFS